MADIALIQLELDLMELKQGYTDIHPRVYKAMIGYISRSQDLPESIRTYLVESLEAILLGEKADIALRIKIKGTGKAKSFNALEKKYKTANFVKRVKERFPEASNDEIFYAVGEQMGMGHAAVSKAYYDFKDGRYHYIKNKPL